MTPQEFQKLFTGQYCNFDGYAGSQCMDLMHWYHVLVLKIYERGYLAAPTAYQSYKNFRDDKFLKKIPNTPTNVPEKGDIIYWNTQVGSAGHVAIFVEGDVNSFTSFDCNWPTGSLPKLVKHDYKGVAGWLRPLVKPWEKQSQSEDEIENLRSELADARKLLKPLEDQILSLNKSREEEITRRVKAVEQMYADKISQLENKPAVEITTEVPVYVDKEVPVYISDLKNFTTKELVLDLIRRIKE